MKCNDGKCGITYTLNRKKMKNIRIRVTGDAQVMVSAPRHVPEARIHAFVISHETFIRERLQDVEKKRNAHYPLNYSDADMFSYLGKRVVLRVCVSSRSAAVFSGSQLTLCLPPGAGPDEVRALFIRWARSEARKVFGQRLSMLLPRFSGAAAMRLSVRDMITRWGSINVKRHTMSLSVHLLRCEPELIDYVITHELCHIAFPRHTASFYAALEARCPERVLLDKRLETYGLVGY